MGLSDIVSAPGTGPSCELPRVFRLQWAIIMHIFHIPAKNVLPVKINDSMIIRNSWSPGVNGVTMSQQNGKHWDLQDCI